MDCIFCKIVEGKIPSLKIYENDVILAFLDINPDSNGHTLIIPKKHYKDINDIDEKTLCHIYSKAKDIMKLLEEKLNADGFSLLQNNGSVQEVKHYHLHIKPYYSSKPSIKLVKDSFLIEDANEIYKKIKES